ncbi:hypothetical protein BY996DRAFT_6594934 [Phakopsora pachyrhizi]|nr:hypothetical protein BY996DRAFT_6594934 [Phakopsora pachyrhizi]
MSKLEISELLSKTEGGIFHKLVSKGQMEEPEQGLVTKESVERTGDKHYGLKGYQVKNNKGKRNQTGRQRDMQEDMQG